jgi:hypothetical protein
MNPKTVVAGAVLALGAALVGSASADDADGVHIEGDFPGGGKALLELEERNVRPLICFQLIHDDPDPGDSISTSIHRGSPARPGPVVVDLSIADQWIGPDAEGCAMPDSAAVAREVFRDPAGHYLEFEVIENQGTAVQRGPFRAALRPG